MGYSQGVKDGYVDGKDDGYHLGYQVGNKDGYDDGYGVGIKNGYDEGYDEGYDKGYEKGKDKGYYEGRADEVENSGFGGLVSAVVDVPIRAFKSLFSFDILGVNTQNLILSLITLALVIIVVKWVFFKK